MFEKHFDNSLWGSRFIVMLAMTFGLIGASTLFIGACVDVFNAAAYTDNDGGLDRLY